MSLVEFIVHLGVILFCLAHLPGAESNAKVICYTILGGISLASLAWGYATVNDLKMYIFKKASENEGKGGEPSEVGPRRSDN